MNKIPGNSRKLKANYDLVGTDRNIRIADVQGKALHCSRLVNSTGYINITVPETTQFLLVITGRSSNIVIKKIF